ncbi:MAG: cell division protein FtsZ [Paludibacteraceae bacterium]|nr:cell division protein FtsZ [Paludibacteraceae bacterium]
MIDFAFPKEINRVIKVVGVGGGGSNAVNHMYKEGIHNVSFAVCNSDIQDLSISPVPTKIQLGESLTGGLGCGGKPEQGRAAAMESEEAIKELLNDGTKMVFVTAGMGGGTGTGAAPVVARIAKEMDILTIGIVTIPFKMELGHRITKAMEGVSEMSKHVDSLLIISNEKLFDYQEMTLDAAFCKANEVLSEAAKGIAEMITLRGEIINIDFADVNSILKNSGVAIMNSGIADGENRIQDALQDALSTPLLKNNNIKQATRILMYVYTSKEHKLTMKELGEISHFIESIDHDREEEVIWGGTYMDDLEKSVKITIIATGFNLNEVTDLSDTGVLRTEYYGYKGKENPIENNAETTPAETPESETTEEVKEEIIEEVIEESPKETKEETVSENIETISFGDWSGINDSFDDLDTPAYKRK